MGSDDRQQLLTALTNYESSYEEELVFRDRFLTFINQHENCFERSLLSGHITGSAWIVNRDFTHAFMTHHAKLNRWLQLGGHADGDENVARVALKEALEESGMEELKLHSSQVFDLDIHVIPERKEVPEHEHYDIRYLIVADIDQAYVISHESNDLAWLPLGEMSKPTSGNASIMRMVEKTEAMRGKMSSRAY